MRCAAYPGTVESLRIPPPDLTIAIVYYPQIFWLKCHPFFINTCTKRPWDTGKVVQRSRCPLLGRLDVVEEYFPGCYADEPTVDTPPFAAVIHSYANQIWLVGLYQAGGNKIEPLMFVMLL